MDENELSYLDDIKAQPDFLDEAPHVPSNQVSFHHISSCFSCTTISWLVLAPSYPLSLRRQGPLYEDYRQQQLSTPIIVLCEDIYAPYWISPSTVTICISSWPFRVLLHSDAASFDHPCQKLASVAPESIRVIILGAVACYPREPS